MKLIATLIAALAAFLATPALAQNIDLRAGAVGSISTFGHNHPFHSRQYGQTFTVPAGQGSVTSFSFRVTLPTTVVFRGVLMAWDPGTDRPTGPILYQSADVSTSAFAPEDVTFTIPGGAPVTPGQAYVIFATTANSVGVGGGDFSSNGADPLAGGQFVLLQMPNQADWTTNAWVTGLSNQDLGVTINFAPAAPPPTIPTLSEWAMLLMALMLAGGGVWVTRNRWA